MAEKTDRQQLEQIVQEWRAVFDSVPDLISVHDADYNIMRVNRAFADAVGAKPADLIGQKCYKVVHDMDEPWPGCPHCQTLKTGQTSIAEIYEPRLKTHLEVIASPTIDKSGRLTGTVHVARNITERKAAEEALRESERRFRELSNLLPQIVFEVDRNMQITFGNRQALELAGYTEEDLDKGLNALDMLVPEYREQAIYDIMLAMNVKESQQFEFTMRRKDGSTFPASVFLNPIIRQGEIAGMAGIVIDLTKDKQLEQQLERIAREWRAVFDSVPELISVHDTDYRIIRVNRAFADAVGAEPADLIGQKCYQVLHKTNKPWPGCPHCQTLETGKTSIAEIYEPRLKTHLEVIASPICDESGQLTGIVHIAHDTTQRKAAEEALRESEETLKAYLENAPDAVYIADNYGNLVYTNKKAEELAGYEKADLIGRNSLKINIVPPKYLARAAKMLARSVAGKVIGPEEFKLKRKDGSVLWVDVRTTPVKHQGKLRIMNFVRDSTERKAAEEALRESEQRYRDVADLLPQIVFQIDKDGWIKFVNRQAYPMTGYTPDDFDRGMSAFQMFVPQDVDKVKSNMQNILQGEISLGNEYTMMRKDGSTFPVKIFSSPIMLEGQVPGLAGIVIDLTKEKQLEQLKDEFIGMVSHELRTPLTTIIGSVNMVLGAGKRLPVKDAQQLLKDAAMAAEELSNILANLLELSRARAERLVLHLEPVNIDMLVKEAVGRLKSRARGHRLIIDVQKKTPAVPADPLRLERILHNLLENAIKYSPQGGEIHIAAKKEDDELVVSVSDQGIGLSQADQTRLFAPFQRLEESQAAGIGLGLMVCRRLVEAHHGRIWVESKKGQGSTFFFTVPLQQQ